MLELFTSYFQFHACPLRSLVAHFSTSERFSGHMHHSLPIRLCCEPRIGQVCLYRRAVALPRQLAFTKCPRGNQTLTSIRMRILNILNHDSLSRRVKHHNAFHIRAVETFPPPVKSLCCKEMPALSRQLCNLVHNRKEMYYGYSNKSEL